MRGDKNMKNMFLAGMSTPMNLFPHERNTSVSFPNYSDAEAFEKDLRQVGFDMRVAINDLVIANTSLHLTRPCSPFLQK